MFVPLWQDMSTKTGPWMKKWLNPFSSFSYWVTKNAHRLLSLAWPDEKGDHVGLVSLRAGEIFELRQSGCVFFFLVPCE